MIIYELAERVREKKCESLPLTLLIGNGIHKTMNSSAKMKCVEVMVCIVFQ